MADALRSFLPLAWPFARAILAVFAALWLGFCAALFFTQRHLLYPSPAADAVSERQTAPGLGLRPYAGGNDALAPLSGEGVRAWVSKEPSAPKILGTVILFHGNGATALQRGVYADALGPLGYRVILAEYPGYGSFPGALTEDSMARADNELIAAARRDFPGPLFAMGESLGSAAAARAVKDNPGAFSGVFLITPWETLSAVASARYPWAPVSLLLRDRHDSLGALKSFSGPILIVAGEQDDVIPNEHAKALFDGLSSKKKAYALLKGGHTTWINELPAQFWPTAAGEAFGGAPFVAATTAAAASATSAKPLLAAPGPRS